MNVGYPLGLGFGQSAPTPSGIEHGQDIEAPLGTPLYAPVSGTAFVATDSVLGRHVIIHSSSGFDYWFGHLSHVAVQPGQQVAQGTPLGATGGAQSDPQRGDATGPHLWFGISRSGTFQNPIPFLDQGAIFGSSPHESLTQPAPVAGSGSPTPPGSPSVSAQPAGFVQDFGTNLEKLLITAAFLFLGIVLVRSGFTQLTSPRRSADPDDKAFEEFKSSGEKNPRTRTHKSAESFARAAGGNVVEFFDGEEKPRSSIRETQRKLAR